MTDPTPEQPAVEQPAVEQPFADVPAPAPAAEAPAVDAPAAEAPAAPSVVPPPPVPAALAPAAAVPVFPNGKPMLDAQGNPVSDKSRLAAALLCWFFGVLGIHRFYVGKIGTGVLMIVTLGGLGVWALIDFVVILLGSFRDKAGKALQNW